MHSLIFLGIEEQHCHQDLSTADVFPRELLNFTTESLTQRVRPALSGLRIPGQELVENGTESDARISKGIAIESGICFLPIYDDFF